MPPHHPLCQRREPGRLVREAPDRCFCRCTHMGSSLIAVARRVPYARHWAVAGSPGAGDGSRRVVLAVT
eukprot:7716599-Lingulodinium_polyedra.AAC.1